MNEPQLDESVDTMDERLRKLASSFAYPLTPDVAGAAGRRLSEKIRRSEPAARARQRTLIRAAVAVIVVLAAIGSLAVPEVQAFVRSLLRIGSIEVVLATPTPVPTPTSTPAPGTASNLAPTLTLTPAYPPAWTQGLAGKTTLTEARQSVPFAIKLPTYPPGLGEPDQVFVQDLDGKAVILGWSDPTTSAEPNLALYELSSSFIGRKSISDTTQLQGTTVHGQEAAWVNGPHVLEVYVGQTARRRWTQLRLVQGNALIWQEGEITYRLETKLPLDEAIRIAESLR